jgi:tetratricopeptide (TPR) repeat protein
VNHRVLQLGAIAAFITVGDALPAQDDYRAKAFAASDAGDTARAADLFFRLFKAGAEDKAVLATGARCLEKTGRYNDALVMLTRGGKKFPREVTFQVGLARVHNLKAAQTFHESGKMDSHVVFQYEDSIREAKRVLRTWPKNRDARLILANAHYSLGQWDKAKKHADELVKRFPKHPGGFIVMGDLAFEHFKLLRRRASGKDADTSEKTMQKIVGSREAARQSYETALTLDPKRAVIHTKLGNLHAWNAEVKQAITEYRDALCLKPSARVNHDWIAKNMPAKERFAFYEKLGEDYRNQPNADDKKTGIFAWYGAAALVADKQYKLGEELYIISVQLNPSYASGYYYAMYSAYFYRKDEESALLHAAEYAKRNPIQFADLVRAVPMQHRDELTKLVRYFAKRAKDLGFPAASRDLNHVLAAIVDTADAWNNFAFMARESGEFKKSEAAYRNALTIQPNSGQLMNDLGVILHYHKGTLEDLDEAEKLYKSAGKAATRVLRTSKSSKEAKVTAKKTVSDAKLNLSKLSEDRAVLKKKPAKKSSQKARKAK